VAVSGQDETSGKLDLDQTKKEDLKNRFQQTVGKILAAAAKVDRDPEEIKLVAVGKTHPLDEIIFLTGLQAEEGFRIAAPGESRVQELLDKEEERPGELNWHFVGHLQRNKVKYLARLNNVSLLHSLDSIKLAREINKRAGKNERQMEVLVQVNIAEDENKFGFLKSEVESFLEKARKFNHLEISGLMTILPHFDNPERCRPYFQEMKNMQLELQKQGYQLPELSMGMTNDFTIAVEEGATILRIGRALFGPRDY